MANSRSHVFKDVATISAAGSNSQGNSTSVPISPVVAVTTVSASSRGVRLSDAQPGAGQEIHNATAVNVKVYPATGAKIGSGATTAAFTLAANTSAVFRVVSARQWRVVKGA